MYPQNMAEEDLKNQIAHDFFAGFSASTLGKIDLCIVFCANTVLHNIHFLWAEAKRGNKSDILESFVQLILTIGKERTFENELPPLFLGAFDCEKIAFIPYYEIMDIFNQNDFNWNVAPSDHATKEFAQLYAMSKGILESKKLQFDFGRDSKELHQFIKDNFTLENEHVHKIQITKNNFTNVYQKWLLKVKDSISIDWNLAKNAGILDADFYLADLLSLENQSLIDKLFVVLRKTHYEFNKTMTFMGTEQRDIASFKDNQESHRQFWTIYERPPKEVYWDYIIDRRDLLVPLDIRERKGAFFTPQIWAMKAHEYLADVLGEDWQSEYVVWDCAAGTGNLFANLTEPRNFYASTLDKADVEIMKELAKNKHLPLLENHIFQFDFLNDCLLDKPCSKHKEAIDSVCKNCRESKVPKALQKVLQDAQKREKLVIFINPPYAEATSGNTPAGTGANKEGVSTENVIYEKYRASMGKASNELFAQFFFRIYNEIPDCILASFSKLKYINSANFIKFRDTFRAKFKKGFMIPAFTFDNVKGQFPIGFLVWDTSKKVKFRKVQLDVFDRHANTLNKKKFSTTLNKHKSLNQWWVCFKDSSQETIGMLSNYPSDFQNQQKVCILSKPNARYCLGFTQNNIIPFAIYFAVRHCIKATWINDRDQFLMPNKEWIKDREFQNDCFAFMLFHGQNRITSKEGMNHFIPFSEKEVGAKEAFESDFMVRFMNGRIKPDSYYPEALAEESRKNPKRDVSPTAQHDKEKQNGFDEESFYIENLIPTKPLEFSEEAQEVFNVGLELWKYYHAQEFRDSKNPYNPNASLYDIKAYFQGFNANGRMNPPQKAEDSYYKDCIGNLNHALDNLAKKIEPKVYQYGFLLD